MDEFKKDITLYIKCDSMIREFNEKSTAMREQRDSYSHRIMSFMNKNNMNDTRINLANCSLKIGNHTNQETLSYQFLHRTFLEYFNGDRHRTEQLLMFIKESRTKENKQVLVRNLFKN